MAATGPDGAAADEEARNPTTGVVIAGCCASAASGHAAAPTTSVMKSRRVTARCPRASQRKDSTPRHGRLLHPSTWVVRDDRDHAAENFFQGGSPKTGPHFPRLTARNRFRPDFRGWRLGECSN